MSLEFGAALVDFGSVRVLRVRRFGGVDYHAPIHCTEHGVDLAAIERFIADGKPEDEHSATEAITAGECPACRPRYVAGLQGSDGAERAATQAGRVHCPCCGTSWELEDGGWVATVAGALQITGERKPVPAGKVIDSYWFVVEAIDPVGGPKEALRRQFADFGPSAERPAGDDLIDDLTESIFEASRGQAAFEAELGRIELEYHLDAAAAEGWRSVASDGLRVLEGLATDLGARVDGRGHEGPGIHISRQRFEELVVEALESIPPEFTSRMENVAVLVADEISGVDDVKEAFGLYEGIPLTRRSRFYASVPDRITIFQDCISRYCDTEEEIVAEVRSTVIHEVGHYFGISDPRLRELGW